MNSRNISFYLHFTTTKTRLSPVRICDFSTLGNYLNTASAGRDVVFSSLFILSFSVNSFLLPERKPFASFSSTCNNQFVYCAQPISFRSYDDDKDDEKGDVDSILQ